MSTHKETNHKCRLCGGPGPIVGQDDDGVALCARCYAGFKGYKRKMLRKTKKDKALQMKPELLDKLIDLAEQQARLVLLELKLPNLMAAWVLMDESGQAQIVATPWKDELEKELYARMLRTMMRQKKVVAYSFVSEAWTRSLEPGEWDKEHDRPVDRIETRNHPERQEAVIACACSKDLSRWKRWRIVREATTEVIIDLKEDPFPESDIEPASWMSDLLK